jgi:RNA-directed DNA polymerase
MCEKVSVSTPHTTWHAIDWRHVNSYVRQLRQAIFLAGKAEDLKKVRTLQRIMLRSFENRALSVRQVTQENAGRKTPGVDGELALDHRQRGALVRRIESFRAWEPLPVRRVYIPKASGARRPLGLPSMTDRAIQAMVKNALEPYWEAKFEDSSYGFRPGRCCQDAIERVYAVLNKGKRPWILDADIKGAFDHVGHAQLLERVGNFPARDLLRKWLEAGYLEDGTMHETSAGTPQGGVISPLLLNIALHGMEQALGIRYRSAGPGNIALDWRCPALVRYADDFVVLCHSKEEAERTQAVLAAWLAPRGLSLSAEKTRIVHIDDGFDFLGFTVRRYPERRKPSGYKLLARPSETAVQELRHRLKGIFRQHRGATLEALLFAVNPIIRGWAQYYRGVTASRTFKKLDGYLYVLQERWVHWRHPKKAASWQRRTYWGPHRERRTWIFGVSKKVRMEQFTWTHIRRHVVVRRFACWDDPARERYWEERMRRMTERALRGHQEKLARMQQWRCPLCGAFLLQGERLRQLIPSGKRARAQLVHTVCYHQSTVRGKGPSTATEHDPAEVLETADSPQTSIA